VKPRRQPLTAARMSKMPTRTSNGCVRSSMPGDGLETWVRQAVAGTGSRTGGRATSGHHRAPARRAPLVSRRQLTASSGSGRRRQRRCNRERTRQRSSRRRPRLKARRTRGMTAMSRAIEGQEPTFTLAAARHCSAPRRPKTPAGPTCTSPTARCVPAAVPRRPPSASVPSTAGSSSGWTTTREPVSGSPPWWPRCARPPCGPRSAPDPTPVRTAGRTTGPG
jgi:hypothetical protein